jgi:hypothetical protein
MRWKSEREIVLIPKAGVRGAFAAVPKVDTMLLLQLAGSNAISIAWCAREHWPLILLLVPYWIQSVVIGWYYRKRILALRRFSTEGFSSNGKPVQETPQAQRETALFLTLHYGFFHAMYALFLGAFAAVGKFGDVSGVDRYDVFGMLALGALFAWTQRSEHRRNVAADRDARPNIGAMMFLPYLRVVPMHLMFVAGALLGDGTPALVVFGVLKTAADIGMQVLGQRLVARGGE